MRRIILSCALLAGCESITDVADPNTYKKCSSYEISTERNITFDMASDSVYIDTAFVMKYEGKSVTLTKEQAKRLDYEPTAVCREVM